MVPSPGGMEGQRGAITVEQALVHLGAQGGAGPRAAEDAGITAQEIRGEASVQLPTWQKHPAAGLSASPGWDRDPPWCQHPPGSQAHEEDNPPMTVLANGRLGS